MIHSLLSFLISKFRIDIRIDIDIAISKYSRSSDKCNRAIRKPRLASVRASPKDGYSLRMALASDRIQFSTQSAKLGFMPKAIVASPLQPGRSRDINPTQKIPPAIFKSPFWVVRHANDDSLTGMQFLLVAVGCDCLANTKPGGGEFG